MLHTVEKYLDETNKGFIALEEVNAELLHLHANILRKATNPLLPLSPRGVRYFQLTHTVKFISHLHVMQIASEEIHNSVILVKQVSLHICIIHLVTEHLAADTVASKTDALGCHHWHPALGVFPKQKHSSNSQCTIWTNKS